MPIYEYRRPDGTTFDVMQSFSDNTLTHDPETGEPVQRVFHAPAIHFKGKGFHNTDYGTRRRNRELEKSAESGANDHADKSKEKADKAKSDTGSSTSSSSESSSSSPTASDAKPKADAPKAKTDAKPAPKRDAA
jgi:putative FmdB family regulatory protein